MQACPLETTNIRELMRRSAVSQAFGGVTWYLQVSTEAAQAVCDGAPGLSCYRAGSCRFCSTCMIRFHSCSMICMAALYSVRQ